MLHLNVIATRAFEREMQKLAMTGVQYLDLANKAASAGRKTLKIKIMNRGRKETMRKWLPQYLALEKENKSLGRAIRRFT